MTTTSILNAIRSHLDVLGPACKAYSGESHMSFLVVSDLLKELELSLLVGVSPSKKEGSPTPPRRTP